METCCNLFCDGTARVFFSDAHDMRGAADETIIRNIHVWASVLRLLERDAMQVLCLRPRCHQGTSRPRGFVEGREARDITNRWAALWKLQLFPWNLVRRPILYTADF